MVKLTVLYGPPTDAAAFEDYYANTHLPLAAKLPNVARFRGVQGHRHAGRQRARVG